MKKLFLLLLTAVMLTTAVSLADSGGWRCSGCGHVNRYSYNYCISCGSSYDGGSYVSAKVIDTCSYCGYDFDEEEEDARYCPSCGASRHYKAYGAVQTGVLNQRLATRTGPGTHYTEEGSYYQSGVSLDVHSLAYDANGVKWVQVEITTNKGKMRVYTGLKRFDYIDESALRVEKPQNRKYRLTRDYTPRHGPGSDFRAFDFKAGKGRTFTVLETENNWAMVDIQGSDGKWYRVWFPLSALKKV